MNSSDFPVGDVLTFPSCHLRQSSKVIGFCRRCWRPLPFAYLKFCIPSALAKHDVSDGDALRRSIGKALRRLRLRQGCTQAVLALAAGTHRTHVSRVERGRVAPTSAFLLRAASALGVVGIILCVRAQEPELVREPYKSDH